MTGQSLVADAFAIVLCVHTLVLPKEQKRLNARVGARSWVLLGCGDCPGGSHRGVHKHWPSTGRPEATEISLKVYRADEEWLGEWLWGNGPSVVGGWVWGRAEGEGEGVRVFARWRLFAPILSGVAQVAVQVAVGTSALLSGFCEFWLQRVHSNGWHWVCTQCQLLFRLGSGISSIKWSWSRNVTAGLTTIDYNNTQGGAANGYMLVTAGDCRRLGRAAVSL